MDPLTIAVVAGISVFLVWAFIDRFWTPFCARRAVQKLLKSKTQLDPRVLENPKNGSLVSEADLLRIKNPKGMFLELRWSEIEEVHAFKRDLFTTDLICLAFKKTGTDDFYEIDEEMEGYHDLLEVLPTRLPNFSLNWVLDVAFPAFETNRRVIWRRTPSTAGAGSDVSGQN